jgi:hypothetical protein
VPPALQIGGFRGGQHLQPHGPEPEHRGDLHLDATPDGRHQRTA